MFRKLEILHYVTAFLTCLMTVCTAASCVEGFKVELDKSVSTCLVVDGLLTTDTTAHCVKLTTSLPFNQLPHTKSSMPLAAGEISSGLMPVVSGARVTITEGSRTVVLEEDGDTGCYYTPSDYYGLSGRTYRLEIDVPEGEVAGHYEAEETMPEKGIRADAMDYYLMTDSLWVFALWGQDLPGIKSHYGAELIVHGKRLPYSSWTFIDGSDMFDGNYLAGGEYLFYSSSRLLASMSGDKEEDYPTDLVEGDVVTLRFYSMADSFYDWFMSLAAETIPHFPIFMPQPANLYANLSGGATGVFGLADVSELSVTIGDPARTRIQMLADHKDKKRSFQNRY